LRDCEQDEQGRAEGHHTVDSVSITWLRPGPLYHLKH
jgi:hypothetical protein